MILAIEAEAQRDTLLEVALGVGEPGQAGFLLGQLSQRANELDLWRTQAPMKLDRLFEKPDRFRGVVGKALSRTRHPHGMYELWVIGVMAAADFDRLRRVAPRFAKVAAAGAPVLCERDVGADADQPRLVAVGVEDPPRLFQKSERALRLRGGVSRERKVHQRRGEAAVVGRKRGSRQLDPPPAELYALLVQAQIEIQVPQRRKELESDFGIQGAIGEQTLRPPVEQLARGHRLCPKRIGLPLGARVEDP